MRLVTAAEMRAIDQHAIEQVGIPSLVLMENAGLKVLFTLEKIFQGVKGKRFTIICGKGNNGGDGLVVARHLVNNDVPLNVFLLHPPQELSPDSRTNFQILTRSGFQPTVMSDRDDLDRLRVALEFSDCTIDAIYGTGFTGQITGFAKEVIQIVNEASTRVVALDLPSGVDATTGKAADVTVRAHQTVCLGAPKVGVFIPPGMKFGGEVWIADIGLPPTTLEAVPTAQTLITQELVTSLLPVRNEHGHKGTFGQVLVLAGSRDYQGAGVLATYGALRSGAGLVSLGVPEGLPGRMACDVLPDVILKTFPEEDGGFALREDDVRSFSGMFRAIVAGPGWGRGEGRKASVLRLLSLWHGGLLLDADALSALGTLHGISPRSADLVLTPHIGEMARLTGKPVGAIQEDLLGTARELVKAFPCVLVLKCSTPVVVGPGGHAYICSRPNSGMARGGSGDLLAGIIGGLMAQGLPGLHAAVAGLYLHAEAGLLARKELGADAMTVSEIASLLPKAFRRLRGEIPLEGDR